jgi:hypothetical protein
MRQWAEMPTENPPRRPTVLQARFAYFLVVEGVGCSSLHPRERVWSYAEAARRAGYSDRNGNARRLGWRARRNPVVREEIRRLAGLLPEGNLGRIWFRDA